MYLETYVSAPLESGKQLHGQLGMHLAGQIVEKCQQPLGFRKDSFLIPSGGL